MAELDIKSIYGTTSRLSGNYQNFIVAYLRKTNKDLKVNKENEAMFEQQ